MIQMHNPIVVLISADAEWSAVRNIMQGYSIHSSLYGEWLSHKYKGNPELTEPIIFMHGGWGKVSVAASIKFAIDNWHPNINTNIGTCGGLEGEVSIGEIILANETIIYDIYKQMGDSSEAIKYYSTKIDNSWINMPFPIPARQYLLISGDRDLFYKEIAELKAGYGAIAVD